MPLSGSVQRFATALLIAVACAFAVSATAGRLALPLATPAANSAEPAFVVKIAGGAVEVVEYHNLALDHYFISADPAEVAALDGGALGGAWKRTGNSFPAWDINGAPADTVPVCRFFGTDRYRPDGSRIGANSHFYTADPAECAFVRTAWQSLANDGQSYPAWTFESNAFAAKLPVGGACPQGTQPLYRAYNNGARGDSNHRYSLSASMLQAMVGWAFEGLVMCLPQGQNVTLPPQMAACGASNCPPSSTRLGSGVGLVSVVVTITNTTTTAQDLVIPSGSTFVATPPTFQDGLAIDTLRATIVAGATRTFVLALFCMQQNRDAATSAAAYAPGPATNNAQLLDVIALAEGKLGGASDPEQLKALSVQSAVWEITDGRGSLTAQQRTLLATLLATPASDLLTMATLAEEFFGTLSNPKP